MSAVEIAALQLLLNAKAPWLPPEDVKLPARLTALEAVTWVATRDSRMVAAVVACAKYWDAFARADQSGREGFGIATAVSEYLKPDVAGFYCGEGHAVCTCCDDAAIAIGKMAARGEIAWSGVDAVEWERGLFEWASYEPAFSTDASPLVDAFAPRASEPSPLTPDVPVEKSAWEAEARRVAAALDDEGVATRDVRAHHVRDRWNTSLYGKRPKVDVIMAYMTGRGRDGRPPKKCRDL